MKHHPDRNPNDKAAERQFKAINEAYGILSDPEKKAAYDQFGHAGVEGAAGGGPEAGLRLDFSGDIFGKYSKTSLAVAAIPFNNNSNGDMI